MQELLAVKLQHLWFGPGFKIAPAVTLGNLALLVGFLRHFQKEQESQFGDVFVVVDAVVLEDVADIPEFLDDVLGMRHDGFSSNGRVFGHTVSAHSPPGRGHDFCRSG
jgi:hypothetical protein